MKRVIFHLSDGSNTAVFGYGSTEQEIINDAESTLNSDVQAEVTNVVLMDPLPSDL